MRLFLSSLFISIILSGLTFALEYEARPSNVYQGDAFVIRVTSNIRPDSIYFMGKDIPFARISDKDTYIAIAAIPIDAAPGRYNFTIRAGGKIETGAVMVSKKDFKKVEITLPKEMVYPDKASMERIERETKELDAIWPIATETKITDGFKPPTDTEVSTEFGSMRILNGTRESIHWGIDYRGKAGTPVRSVNSGTIVVSEEMYFGGNTLIIDHGMGIYSIYLHLSSFAGRKGERVQRGAIIGYIGMTGRATGPHLHFGMRVHGVRVNPESIWGLVIE